MDTQLYLIRHGETDWNAERRIQGSIDRPLNALGRAQAETLAAQFAHVSLSAIYSSPLLRAKETADIINQHHSCRISLHAALKEGCFGSAEGMTWSSFQEVYQSQLSHVHSLSRELRVHHKIPEDSESHHEVAVRALTVVDQAVKEHPGGSILIVCHGWVIRSLLIKCLDVDDLKVSVSNCGYVRLVARENGFDLLESSGVEF